MATEVQGASASIGFWRSWALKLGSFSPAPLSMHNVATRTMQVQEGEQSQAQALAELDARRATERAAERAEWEAAERERAGRHADAAREREAALRGRVVRAVR